MKNLVLVLLSTVLVIALATTANGQERKIELMVGGGIDSPLHPKEFTDGFKLGFTGKIAAGYYMTPRFILGINASYNRFGMDKSIFGSGLPNVGFNIDGGNLSILEVSGIAKYNLLPISTSSHLYMLGGPGVAFSRISDVTVTIPGIPAEKFEGENETDFMLTGGVGLKYNLNSRLGLFVEGRYSHVFMPGSDSSYMPIRAGLVF